MDRVELYHPVTEDKAREFVDATYTPGDSVAGDEDAQQREKDATVESILTTARENAAWRDSRSPDERIELKAVPFAHVESGEEE